MVRDGVIGAGVCRPGAAGICGGAAKTDSAALFVMGAGVGDAEIQGQAVCPGEEILDAVSDGFDADAASDVGGEGVSEEMMRGGLGDAARLEIKDQVVIDGAGG